MRVKIKSTKQKGELYESSIAGFEKAV
jgi:hypothetical protein